MIYIIYFPYWPIWTVLETAKFTASLQTFYDMWLILLSYIDVPSFMLKSIHLSGFIRISFS